jgi:hypothetical protein
MIEWSWDAAIPIPMAMPTMTNRTASLKLNTDAFILDPPSNSLRPLG